MYYELALISVVVAGAYWGVFFVSRQPHGTATFGLMQLGAALLSGIGLYAERYEGAAWMHGAGAIGLGAGVCLLIVAPLLRGFARRLAARERLGIARRLLDVADLIAPGSGAADEKALLGAMQEIRDGHIEETIVALSAAKDRAPAEARLAIDERIAMLYLAAYQWDNAIAHAEANLFGAHAHALPSEAEGAPPSLRRALGFAPPVWVELLGAYGRTGDLDRAAQMLARLEDVCAGRDDAAVWIHRARLMFLALAGRPAAVEALVDPRRARHMSLAARQYWLAVALEHKGDRAAATAAYEKARGRSRGRPREMIDEALSNLARADGVPTQLSDEANQIVARVEAAPLPAEVHVPTPVRPWATYSATAFILAVAATITLTVGPTSDVGVLMRAGALVRGFVDGGEWWRIFSCVFVQVGGLQLLVNVIGIWFVGRIAEEMFGTVRTIALFGVPGFAGAVASYLATSGGISAGASGALFGLIGAVFVELTLHRDHYRALRRRGMWGGLALIVLAQLGYGLVYDQWAHGAGLVTGALLGGVLSPHAPWARAVRSLGFALALVVIAFTATAAVRVAGTSIEDSFRRQPRLWHTASGVELVAPAGWTNDGELAEPDGLIIVSVKRAPNTDFAAQVKQWVAETTPTIARDHGFEQVGPAPSRVLALPAGWEGAELLGTFVDPLGYEQRYRLISCGRVFDDEVVTVVISVPDSITRPAQGYLVRILKSVRLPS
ncbi:MAG TPA: rhomboid family intramembrane serine protease [Kofleriaceae bacterium]|nr:rhomboid family intramembrane serine protease [Kofleriaceae bacterium]